MLWYLADNLGTVRDLAKATVDGSGNVTDVVIDEHYNYDSFGNVLAGDTSKTRYLYTGREFDEDTGLQYNRRRWYDPATGKWLSEDPIGFTAGDANLSRYVGNGVTNATDASGLEEGWLEESWIGSYINTHIYEFSRPDGVLPPRWRNDDEMRDRLMNQETAEWEAGQAAKCSDQNKLIHDVVSAPFRFKLRTYDTDDPNIQVLGYNLETGEHDSIDNYPIDGSIAVRFYVPAYNAIATVGDVMANPDSPLSYSGALLPMRSGGNHWLLRGAEKDAEWLALSAREKLFYEIGQKTMCGDSFYAYEHLSPVRRGEVLVDKFGWRDALLPEGAGWRLGMGETFHTGPTPSGRWIIRSAGGTVGSGVQSEQNMKDSDR